MGPKKLVRTHRRFCTETEYLSVVVHRTIVTLTFASGACIELACCNVSEQDGDICAADVRVQRRVGGVVVLGGVGRMRRQALLPW